MDAYVWEFLEGLIILKKMSIVSELISNNYLRKTGKTYLEKKTETLMIVFLFLVVIITWNEILYTMTKYLFYVNVEVT